VDGTGSGLCAVVGFVISDVEALCSANRRFVLAIERTAEWRVPCANSLSVFI